MRGKKLAMLVALAGSCGRPPPAAPPAPKPALVAEAPADGGAVWGERIERAFVALTTKNLVAPSGRATAAAAWAALGEAPAELPADDGALAGALRARVAEKVGKQALPPERVWAAIDAMAEVVDNVHAMRLDPGRMAQLVDAVGGGKPFVMPGVVIHWTPQRELVVSEVVAGTPAAAAGLAVGDVIVSVDGRPPRRVGPLFPTMFVPAGTRAVFRVKRAGAEQDVPVVLEPFLHPVGTHRVLPRGIGLVRLYYCGVGPTVDRNHVQLMRAALADFDAKGVRHLLIDLRGNLGGGDPQGLVSIFTTADPILYARAPGDAEDFPWKRKGEPWPRVRPMAVLVDEQTVSCGEMIAYGLAVHGVARLFGQPTGDALHVPDELDLGEGNILWVPLAAVLDPRTRKPPAGHRVTPDELVPNRSVGELLAGKDRQLDAALKWLARQRTR